MTSGLAPQRDDVRSRTVRLYRYFRDNPGRVSRDQVMHWTGFPSPKADPIIAYVEFENAMIRLNRVLARSGRMVVGGLHTHETYQLEESV